MFAKPMKAASDQAGDSFAIQGEVLGNVAGNEATVQPVRESPDALDTMRPAVAGKAVTVPL